MQRLAVSPRSARFSVPTTLLLTLSLMIPLARPVQAEDKAPKAREADATAPSLSAKEIADGWIMLFDGATPFGWKVETEATIAPGSIKAKGAGTLTSTTSFGDFDLAIEAKSTSGKNAEVVLNGKAHKLSLDKNWSTKKFHVESKGGKHTVKTDKLLGGSAGGEGASHTPVIIRIPAGVEIEIRAINLKPLNLKSIFNGKDLTGWKALSGEACKNCKAEYTVTPKGELNVKNGPGDLHSEGEYQNFILQLDVISYGEHLNSGIFFRDLPGQFWQGYEAQVRNEWQGYSGNKDEAAKAQDRTKPIDYGTGGVYNRQKSRKVVSSDKEWFTYTILADGAHVALWVNGYQTADYVDEAQDAPSARKGRYLGKGNLGLQGHDPTTNLSFRNINIAELPAAK